MMFGFRLGLPVQLDGKLADGRLMGFKQTINMLALFGCNNRELNDLRVIVASA